MTPARDPSAPGLAAYANMCAPPRTKVQSCQLAVSGRAVIFCTELACIFHGLLPGADRQAANAAAVARWQRDPRRFVAAIRRAHLRGTTADRELAAWTGPVIGWTPRKPNPADGWRSVVCTDLAWTLAVLGRVEGPLLLPRRRPRLSWERLFGEPFALDDVRLAGVAGVSRDQIGPRPGPGATP